GRAPARRQRVRRPGGGRRPRTRRRGARRRRVRRTPRGRRPDRRARHPHRRPRTDHPAAGRPRPVVQPVAAAERRPGVVLPRPHPRCGSRRHLGGVRMIRLLGVELTRFRSRRAVALLLLAGVLITAVIAGATAWNTRGVSEFELRYAQELAQSEAEQPSFQEELADCQQNADDWGVAVDECEQIVLPSPSWYLDRTPLDLETERSNSALGAATVLAGLAIMIGATFAGADWASGSMSNQLLFEPRRARVWLAKAVVVVLGTALLALVALSALWACYAAVVSARDLATAGDVLGPIRGDVLRAVAVCAAAGLGGLSLSMLFRSTVATVAVTFVVTVAGEI